MRRGEGYWQTRLFASHFVAMPPANADSCVNLADFRAIAEATLPPMVWDYYASGANDEITLEANTRSFSERRLRYRVLRDVASRSSRTSILGTPLDFPVVVAPMAYQRLAHADGEVATARAAAAAGIVMTLSTLATSSLEDVRAASAGPLWFQLYVYTDRGVTRDIVQRAEAAGYSALVVTVDLPVLGRRERDIRNGFHTPADLTIPNMLPLGLRGIEKVDGDSGLARFARELLDASLSWRDIEWLKSVTTLPVIVKGIVRGDDAGLAVDAGVSAIVASNHGGRQLDTAIPALDALEEIVAAVDGRVEVLVDGGVRRGTDILKAIALGARAVMLGRPVLWGLAAGGEAGVRRVLDLLRDEFDVAMALSGCQSVEEIGRDLVLP